MDPHLLRPRPAYGAGSWVLLQWPCPSQVRPVTHMAIPDEYSSGGIPVVFLGLQLGFQSYW